MSSGVDIKISGPIARGRALPLLRQAASAGVRDLIEQGEDRLAEVLSPRPKGVYLSVSEAGKNASKGNYRRNLTSLVRNLTGVITDGGVVYGPWLEGLSSRNVTTRFKGYFAFRRTQKWLNDRKASVMDKHMRSFVRRMR